MTRPRMRDNRSDWEAFSARKRAQTLASMQALAGGMDSTTDEQRKLIESPSRPRSRPVQHESHEMEALAQLVNTAWWAHGYQRWEHRSRTQDESEQRWREGATSGWPDCGLFIPATAFYGGLRAVVEMKAEDHRPKRGTLEECWWLDEFPDDRRTRHGLRLDQQFWLRTLHYAGLRTRVVFGASDAFAWLQSIAGPKPRELPATWTAMPSAGL